MDPGSQERPQGDPRQLGTNQEDTAKTQGRDKKKRKCRFSTEEHEILVREVTEHQHQLFITSKLPIGRREAIWQQIVDKINSVAEIRRTVTECKKRWLDCKRRTKEKMARNRKAALQTGGGSPAPQEGLDEMEEMVAAAIPEENVTGIAGQDSADYQETTHREGNLHGGPKCLNVKCKKGEAHTYYTMHVSPANQAVERAKGHGTGLPALPMQVAWAVQVHPGAQHNTPPTTFAWGYTTMPRLLEMLQQIRRVG
ncbi:hypothetical protein NDU88_004494 [Pleurodeles waltl]|uniref:Nuclear apoptosis-inducing factor 1 n=1 Tax=Pleurodeles waltl TaxID=8319 RepID=A0AAV7RKM0_PLEWA|nr:hypothetical protein NDU88_004494 [Pleurodeles waltl]